MTQETKTIEKSAQPTVERTSERRVFTPLTDIVENKEAILVLADLPGVDEKDLDITLDKNVLTIKGNVQEIEPKKDFSLLYEEVEFGDFERSFTLSNEIDRDGIRAHLENGVLRLTLPKAKEHQPRKIAVKGL